MEKESFIIRNAEQKDVDGLVNLLKQLFSIEKDFHFNTEKHCRGLWLMLDGCSKHRAVKVALHDNKIVGMCTIQTRISTAKGCITAVIEDLVVDADHRGRGIGKNLLTKMYQWAQERNIHHLQLLADKDNAPALNFYDHRKWVGTNLVCLTRNL